MKNLATLLLLTLILLPVAWNGIGLLHYMVEHTHTFCSDDSSEHSHKTSEECLNVCQLISNQHPQQLPSSKDFQELKQFLTPNLLLNTYSINPSKQSNFIDSFILEKPFYKDIFLPPIC